MGNHTPSFTITNEILSYVSSISEKIGRITAIGNMEVKPHLRKNNRIKSIHSPLKIEANSLSLGQVQDVINGKAVLGEQKEIQEVKNAYAAYERFSEIDPYSIKSLKQFHGIMTNYVVEESGEFRHGEEGIFNGDQCIFMAPPAQFVPQLMDELFLWMKEARGSIHPLVLSSVFHYEFMLSQINKILDEVSVQIYDIPYTSSALIEKLGLKSREGFRRNYLRPGIELPLILMTMPDKPNSRNQRYVKL